MTGMIRGDIIRGEAHSVSALLDRPLLEKVAILQGHDKTLERVFVSADGGSVDALSSSLHIVINEYDAM
jgi:hypothetical protein